MEGTGNTTPGEPKPERLYHETYLQMINNSVGSGMFRNFYVRTPDQGTFDALADGSNSCAFYVSGLLVLFKKLQGVHGTIDGTVQDLETSGWKTVENIKDIQPGDVIIWEQREFSDGTYGHMGFALGAGQATSTSWTEKVVVQHDLYFGDAERPITQLYRMDDWS